MDNLSPMPTHSTNKQEHYQQVGDLSIRYTDERGTKYTEVHRGPRYTGEGLRTCQAVCNVNRTRTFTVSNPLNSMIDRRVLSSTFNWRIQRTQGAMASRVSLKHSPYRQFSGRSASGRTRFENSTNVKGSIENPCHS